MSFGQNPTVIDMIPGGRAAVQALVKVAADFQKVPYRLQIILKQSQGVLQAADQKGDYSSSADASAIIDTAQGLQSQYASASMNLSQVMQSLNQSGMLAGTFDDIATAVMLAAQVGTIMTGTNNLEQASQNLAVSVLGASQANSYKGGGMSFSQYLLYGALIYGGFWALKRSKGTRKW